MAKRPTISPAMRLAVFRDFGAVCLCQVCGDVERIADMDLDHHLALIDTGEHAASNLRPLCHSCHSMKSANEHRNNSKAKRLAAAQQTHSAIVAKVAKKEPSRIKPAGFKAWRKFNGSIVRK